MTSSYAFVLLASVGCTLTLDILPVTKNAEPNKEVDPPNVTLQELNDAYDAAAADLESRRDIEDNLPPSGLVLAESHSVEARHQRFLAFDQTIADLDYNASLLLSGSIYLKETLGLSNDQATFGLPKVTFPPESKWSNTLKQCRMLFKDVTCDATSKYRTYDGTCNNLEHPNWGRSHSCMGRFVPPVYNDGLSDPRQSKSKQALPNVRNISLHIHEALVTPNATYTHMIMPFGQFVTHDVTMGLMTRTMGNHTMMSCCPLGVNTHAECSMGISIPPNQNDFFSNHGQDCMNFVRAALCNSECTLGPRQQSTRITAYADSSNIYGSSEEDLKDLRAYKDGRLQSQMVNSEEYLPFNAYPTTDQCTKTEEDLRCFKAGDKRVNENPPLSSIHNLFLRHHNRLAGLFKEAHPTYNDEELFQLTRRVVNAHYQNILFSEYLPVLLGPKYVEYFGLTTGTDSVYQPDTHATIFNEFMTAAMRYGHSTIQNTLERGPGSNSSLNLDEVYLSPFILFQGEFDPILKGLASQPGKLFDQHLVTAVTHTLYRQKEVAFGMDLAALNIQRGRDHGTERYTKYLQHCFNRTISCWEDLDDFMSSAHRTLLQSVFVSPDDVDLFTGGVIEDRLTYAAVGPTFGCLLGSQFYALKYGDRFHYEHKDQTGSFTPDQLEEIRKVTLSNIICKNTKSVAEITPNVFKIISSENAMTPCTDIPDFDHTLF